MQMACQGKPSPALMHLDWLSESHRHTAKREHQVRWSPQRLCRRLRCCRPPPSSLLKCSMLTWSLCLNMLRWAADILLAVQWGMVSMHT